MTRQELSLLALLIRDGGRASANAENIRQVASTTAGAEALRLIVRDDLEGVADLICNALWINL